MFLKKKISSQNIFFSQKIVRLINSLIFISLNSFQIKDLYEFAKNKTIVTGLAFAPNGKRFATLSTDRKVRVFTFLTGKLIRVFDEALARYQEMQQTKHALPNMEFGRK